MMSAPQAEPAVPSTWLTPRPSRAAPVHRWFVFPHSYGPQLVQWVLDLLDPPSGGVVLDPFCGAGTTLVEAQRLGFKAVGVDLLPLATLVSRAKANRPSKREFRAQARRAVQAAQMATPSEGPPPVLNRALSPEAHGRLSSALAAAGDGPAGDCIRVAVLSIVRRFATLVADGGWLRATEPELPAAEVPQELSRALAVIEEDLAHQPRSPATVIHADSRGLPLPDRAVDAVITSPPYPNRHDYTRVFAVELELAFGLGEDMRALRYRALRSHPEARPPKRDTPCKEPRTLTRQIATIAERHPDSRIPRMLRGYFRDLYHVLLELRRVLAPGSRAAFVVGNAQYCGVPIPVDEHLADLGERAGFTVEGVHALRMRGNSAQQMGAFGRQASRESVVHLCRP